MFQEKKVYSRLLFLKNGAGFTFIDVMVGISLMLIVFLGIFGAYQFGIKVATQSGNRVMAMALANQKIEEIRNLSYPEVKYTPEGKIIKTETSPDNKYTISTTIIPVIDCFDGPRDPNIPECVEAPFSDNCEDTDIDYKRVKVKVSWGGQDGGEVNLITDVVPETLSQECGELGGVLSISVIDANFEEVSYPKIDIIDPETSVIVASEQPSDGSYDFSLLPQQYKVKVTVFGYEEETYGQGDIYYYSVGQGIVISEPEMENPLIEASEITDCGFQMDELGAIEVKTIGIEEEQPVPISYISFTIWGTKLIGKDSEGDPIYKYIHNDSTDEGGERMLPDLEFDSYYFSISSLYYDLTETDPPQPVDLLPADEGMIVNLILDPENSLLVTVVDMSTSNPIFGASVHLYNLDYDQTRPTNEQGQSFFAPLESTNYNLEIMASGYESHQEEISISEGEDKIITVELTPL